MQDHVRRAVRRKMAELSLYLSNVSVSLASNMDVEKTTGRDFESVELGDQVKKRQKLPRRTIHFASGEIMEEYSTDDEEDEEEEEKVQKRDLTAAVDPSKMTWGPFFWFYMWRVATSTLSVCDYLGERMASLFGITSPKYQYAIDEYYRVKKEEEEEEEENKLSEEAERHFQEQQTAERKQAMTEQPEGSASFVNVTFESEEEPKASLDTSRVPAPLPS
ncbi:C14orf24-like [Scleropages formosus]|uniref:C14orf24-like n=1 Tax=Scleropages formosus TaxID=113540 RepID=A0A0P7XGF7_SCLFO|nr:protein FAM177A1 [Scleropages formosus]KPP75280.1 C14orf24-like [Scleropages formosus]